jgi:hypothetical protein
MIGRSNLQLLICFCIDATELLSIPRADSYRGRFFINMFPWFFVVIEDVVVVDFKALTIDSLVCFFIGNSHNTPRFKTGVRHPDPPLI